RSRTRRAAAPVLALGVLLTAAASAGAAPVDVSLGFDDGMGTRNDPVAILRDTGAKATFYVNTALVDRASASTPDGEAFNREFLSWDQLQAIQAEGHEIAGHTRTHRRLTAGSAATEPDPATGEPPAAEPAPTDEELEREVCDDRRALLAHGFPALSFAYPFGRADERAAAAVRDCGYLGARTTTEPDGVAESIPPADPYAIRAVSGDGLSAAQMLALVDRARANGGGWVQFLFHDVCTAEDDACSDHAYSVNPRQLRDLADGLAARWDVRVRTAGDVLLRGPLPAPSEPAAPGGPGSGGDGGADPNGGGGAGPAV
ncbi:polysaccharide deacetylase family protein, partial [Patulibacter sp. S7RM1-6]